MTPSRLGAPGEGTSGTRPGSIPSPGSARHQPWSRCNALPRPPGCPRAGTALAASPLARHDGTGPAGPALCAPCPARPGPARPARGQRPQGRAGPDRLRRSQRGSPGPAPPLPARLPRHGSAPLGPGRLPRSRPGADRRLLAAHLDFFSTQGSSAATWLGESQVLKCFSRNIVHRMVTFSHQVSIFFIKPVVDKFNFTKNSNISYVKNSDL